MAKRPAARKQARKKKVATTRRRSAAKTTRTAKTRTAKARAVKPPRTTADSLTAPLKGAELRQVGHVQLEVGPAGAARVKRTIYPVGFRWSVDMKPVVGTDLCMHAHVGFLARGRFHVEYADGCTLECKAPQIVAIDPGHDGWVVGNEPAVLIEFDFEKETIDRLGMPAAHRHE
jgi:hypothetical protein